MLIIGDLTKNESEMVSPTELDLLKTDVKLKGAREDANVED